jgi:hypothetical protein
MQCGQEAGQEAAVSKCSFLNLSQGNLGVNP